MVYRVSSLILLIVLFVVVLYYEHKKNDRESHEFWRSEVRANLKKLVSLFEYDCKEITEDMFDKYNHFISNMNFSGYVREHMTYSILSLIQDHNEQITELSNTYKEEVDEKMKDQMGKYTFKTVPGDLRREYEADISKIADIYRGFNGFMWSSVHGRRSRS